MKITTTSKEETQALAYQLGQALKQGITMLLFGDLGVGKTTFVQGLAKGLNITDRVNSPTFVIMKEYEGRLPLVHIDAYRLEGLSNDLGIDEYDEHWVKVVEWPQYLYNDTTKFNCITITRISENTRQLQFDFVDQDVLKFLGEDYD